MGFFLCWFSHLKAGYIEAWKWFMRMACLQRSRSGAPQLNDEAEVALVTWCGSLIIEWRLLDPLGSIRNKDGVWAYGAI